MEKCMKAVTKFRSKKPKFIPKHVGHDPNNYKTYYTYPDDKGVKVVQNNSGIWTYVGDVGLHYAILVVGSPDGDELYNTQFAVPKSMFETIPEKGDSIQLKVEVVGIGEQLSHVNY